MVQFPIMKRLINLPALLTAAIFILVNKIHSVPVYGGLDELRYLLLSEQADEAKSEPESDTLQYESPFEIDDVQKRLTQLPWGYFSPNQITARKSPEYDWSLLNNDDLLEALEMEENEKAKITETADDESQFENDLIEYLTMANNHESMPDNQVDLSAELENEKLSPIIPAKRNSFKIDIDTDATQTPLASTTQRFAQGGQKEVVLPRPSVLRKTISPKTGVYQEKNNSKRQTNQQALVGDQLSEELNHLRHRST